VKPSALHRHFRTLPIVPLSAITGDAPLLVVAPHQDDESLGCGGLIAAACAAGTPPIVVFVTDGAASHPGSLRFGPTARRDIREREARHAATALGLTADRLMFLRLPDGAAPHQGSAFGDAVDEIARIAEADGSRTICAPWEHDPHGDHVASHKMGRAAAERVGARLLSYPVWGWTLTNMVDLPAPMPEGMAPEGMAPEGMRLDVSDHLSAKRAAIAAHASQHGFVITDDPGGFVLPPEFLALFDTPFEVYLRAAG